MRTKPKRYTGRGDRHFITFSCYQRRPLLETVRAKNRFVKILDQVRKRHEFLLLGYVVMPEHVHLLSSEPKRMTPSRAMQILKQRVSRRMRGRPKTSWQQLPLRFPGDESGLGRFWQRRFYDFNVYTKKKIQEKLDYMHTNPVKRKLVKHPTEWPWSSFSFCAKGESGLIVLDKI